MQIQHILDSLESWAPLSFQETYDNAGLITGDPNQECTGVLCTLDCTEQVVEEAITNGFNLIVCHHPIIFKGHFILSKNALSHCPIREKSQKSACESLFFYL